MRMVILGVVSAAVVIVSFQLFHLYGQANVLKTKLGELEHNYNFLTDENKKIEADLKYFANPLNLSKELRARFNYKKPGEKIIIVVPKQP